MKTAIDTLPAWLDRLAMTLLHSLWIGGVAALVLATLLFTLLRHSRPAVRCRAAEITLLLFTLATALVFVSDSVNPARPLAGPAITSSVPDFESSTALVPGGHPHAEGNAFLAHSPYLPPLVSRSLGLFWLFGALLALGRQGAGWFRLHRLCLAASPVTDPTLLNLFERCRARLGIRERIGLRVSREIESPLMAGFLWPTVLLPLSLAEGVPIAHLQAVFAHELAHHRRWDYLANLFFRVVGALFFFHPLTWWLLRLIEVERERACDDLAVTRSCPRADYLRALAWLELRRSGEITTGSLPLPAPALRLRPGSTAERMHRLLHPDPARFDLPFLSRGPAPALLASMVALVSGTSLLPDTGRAHPPSGSDETAPVPAWLESIQKRASEVRRVRRYLEESPATWDGAQSLFTSPLVLEKNGKAIRLDREDPPLFEEFPNAWVLTHRLDFFRADLPATDPDGDGFTVLEEYQAGTDPRSAESFPPLTEKLHFEARRVRLYRVSFDARPDGRHAQLTRHASAAFERGVFSLLPGERSPDGQLQVKAITDEAVEIVHLPTATRRTLSKRETVEIPTWFAEFRFSLSSPGEPFHVREGDSFRLPPGDGETRYRLEQVSASGASVIELGPGGEETGAVIEIR